MKDLLNVSKQQVKAAFKKLELYRVVITKPQSGTYFIDVNRKILIGLIENIISIGNTNRLEDLLDMRTLLEVKAVELAAVNSSANEQQELLKANEIYRTSFEISNLGMEDDFFFHQEIVRFSHNPLLISLYSFIALEMVDIWRRFHFVDNDAAEKRMLATYDEHREIVNYISEGNATKAAAVMTLHLNNSYRMLSTTN